MIAGGCGQLKKFQADLDILGYSGDLTTKTNLKEIKRCFKKKSLAMLPEKHPTVAYAHTRFEEVNAAFVRVKLPQCQSQ